MTVLSATAITVLGLVVGSFLNVVVYRVPRGRSVVRPVSACPHCGRPIRRRHNVPVLGWLVLRGRCADCSAPISVRYPLVELATGGLFLVLFEWADRTRQLNVLPALLYFGAIGLALALIDLDCRRLPDAIVLPAYPVLAVLLTGSAALRQDWWSLARAGAGGLLLFGFFALLACYPSGMGFGDVKLAGPLGALLAYLSWAALVVGAFTAFALGALAGLWLVATRRRGRGATLPFGPFLVAGALLAVFTAEPIATGYLALLSA